MTSLISALWFGVQAFLGHPSPQSHIPQSVATAAREIRDFNGDQIEDFLIYSRTGSTTPGSAWAELWVQKLVPTQPARLKTQLFTHHGRRDIVLGVRAVDFYGDGFPELVVIWRPDSRYPFPEIEIYDHPRRGSLSSYPTSSFSMPPIYSPHGRLDRVQMIAAKNQVHQPHEWLAIGSETLSPITGRLGQGYTTLQVMNGQLQVRTQAPVTSAGSELQLIAGDLNSDGVNDLVARHDHSMTIMLRNRYGDLLSQSATSFQVPCAHTLQAQVLSPGSSIWVLCPDRLTQWSPNAYGAWQPQANSIQLPQNLEHFLSMQIGDLNEDRDFEIYTIAQAPVPPGGENYPTHLLGWGLNLANGTAQYEKFVEYFLGHTEQTQASPEAWGLYDFNGDAKRDIGFFNLMEGHGVQAIGNLTPQSWTSQKEGPSGPGCGGTPILESYGGAPLSGNQIFGLKLSGLCPHQLAHFYWSIDPVDVQFDPIFPNYRLLTLAIFWPSQYFTSHADAAGVAWVSMPIQGVDPTKASNLETLHFQAFVPADPVSPLGFATSNRLSLKLDQYPKTN